MNAGSPDFTFGLSRDELLWLSAALGLPSLPMPEASFMAVPPQELSVSQQTGAESLRRRGLLHQAADGTWQLERLPAALLQEMSAAAEWLRLDYRARSGMTRSLHFFAAAEIRFLLDLAEGYARFCLCADSPTAAEALWGWLSLPPGLETGEGEVFLPQPLELLPLAWKDPELAARVLNEHSLPSADISPVLRWTAVLEWVSAATLFERRAGNVSVALRFVSCGSLTRMWGGFEREGLVSLSGLASADLYAALSELP